MSSQQDLQQAYSLIKAGNKQEAARLLVNILKTERDNADAWWLLANASPDNTKARQALQQVLRIRPDHAAARSMMDKLDAELGGTSSSSSASQASPSSSDSFGSSSSAPQASNPFGSSNDPFGSTKDPFASASTPSWANDPFGSSSSAPASSTPSRPSAPQNDPFGDPFASSAPRPSAPQNDPFGDPFASAAPRADPFGSGSGEARKPTIGDDPFGDPFASAAPRASSQQADPFADDPFMQASTPRPRASNDDPFAGGAIFERAQDRRAAYNTPPKKSGTNPIVIILAVIGILAVLICGAVIIFSGMIVNQVANVVNDPNFVNTLAASSNDPGAVQTLAAISGANPSTIATLMAQNGSSSEIGSTIIGNVIEKGAIVAGQPIRAVLEDDGFTNHGYKFQGTAGQHIVIEVTATRGEFDTKLTLLGAGDVVITYNDDIDFANDNLNSRIETTLPSNGAYTIVVGDVGSDGGEYELTLN